jgi:hypothetical protein
VSEAFGFSFYTRKLEYGLRYSMGMPNNFEHPKSHEHYLLVANEAWKMLYPQEVSNACRR